MRPTHSDLPLQIERKQSLRLQVSLYLFRLGVDGKRWSLVLNLIIRYRQVINDGRTVQRCPRNGIYRGYG